MVSYDHLFTLHNEANYQENTHLCSSCVRNTVYDVQACINNLFFLLIVFNESFANSK